MTKQEQALLIDEYGELDRQIAAFASVPKRHKVLKDIIAGWFDASPEEEHEAHGRLYTVRISARAREHTFLVDPKNWRKSGMFRLYRFLGMERFFSTCKFPVSEVKALTPDPVAFLEETRTGTRTVKPILQNAITESRQKAA
jgi:hypothetical protein